MIPTYATIKYWYGIVKARVDRHCLLQMNPNKGQEGWLQDGRGCGRGERKGHSHRWQSWDLNLGQSMQSSYCNGFFFKSYHCISQRHVQAMFLNKKTYYSPHGWSWGFMSDPSSPFYTLVSRFGFSYAENRWQKSLSAWSLHLCTLQHLYLKHLCSTAAVFLASCRCFAVSGFQILFWMLLWLPSHCLTEHLVVLIWPT